MNWNRRLSLLPTEWARRLYALGIGVCALLLVHAYATAGQLGSLIFAGVTLGLAVGIWLRHSLSMKLTSAILIVVGLVMFVGTINPFAAGDMLDHDWSGNAVWLYIAKWTFISGAMVLAGMDLDSAREDLAGVR